MRLRNDVKVAKLNKINNVESELLSASPSPRRSERPLRIGCANRQKRLRHCYRGSRYACARSAPEQASVRKKRAPEQPLFLRAKRAPWTAPGSESQANDKTRNQAKRHRNLGKNIRGRAFRARRFTPGSGGSVADTPHIFCRLAGVFLSLSLRPRPPAPPPPPAGPPPAPISRRGERRALSPQSREPVSL
jgi:hypothetical protein